MLWLVLLGIATFLGIALRRVLRRQGSLDDELYSKKVAVDQVQSGVAWVRGDATFGNVNQSFAKAFRMAPGEFAGREWYKVFNAADHARIREAYSEMMLGGIVTLEVAGARADGSTAWLNVRLVAVHDHQMRFVGHHCMIEDKTREHELEAQVMVLKASLAQVQAPAEEPVHQTAMAALGSLDALRRAAGRSVISVLNNARKTSALEVGLPLTATH